MSPHPSPPVLLTSLRLYDMTNSPAVGASSAPRVSDDKDWATGDVHLVSSDGVRFRVDSAVLIWSSPVFAEALSSEQRQRKVIHLSHPGYENADTLRLFLQLVTVDKDALRLFTKHFTKWRFRLEALLLLLDRYQCERGIAILRDLGSDNVLFLRKNGAPDSMLLFAALLNHVGLCSKIFQIYSNYCWSDTPGLLQSRKSETCATLVHAPYSLYCALPREYVWAMSRAGLYADAKTESAAFGHKFVELIMAIEESAGESARGGGKGGFRANDRSTG